MKNQIDPQVKQDRLDTIMSDQLLINAEINEAKIGKTLTVLYEGFDTVSQTHFGRTAADAPDIDGKVYFKVKTKTTLCEGDFVKVEIRDVIDYDLYGVLAE